LVGIIPDTITLEESKAQRLKKIWKFSLIPAL
jgi:hypothetical protein